MSQTPQERKKAAMEAARMAALENKNSNHSSEAPIIKYIDPSSVKERIRILGDDSGSMDSQFKNATRGIEEFLRNCIPNQTAVAVHWLNNSSSNFTEEEQSEPYDTTKLTTNLPRLSRAVKETLANSGGTPLFTVLKGLFDFEPKLSRAVLFTDGQPTDFNIDFYCSKQKEWLPSADIIIEIAVRMHIPIDCVFFGEDTYHSQKPIELLKYISEKTGGFFMIFDPKKVDFGTAFKYLAPVNRMMLASESVRKEIESGKRK